MSTAQQQLSTYMKKNWIPVLVFILASLVTHVDGNAAMVVGEGFGIYAFILLLLLFVRFASWVVHRAPEKTRSLKKTGLRFAYAVVLCAVSWQGLAFVHHQINARFQPLIEKLEAYKTGHGKYPENTFEIYSPSVGEAAINADNVSGNSLGYPFCSYTLGKKDDQYCITCMTYGFNHHSYCSGAPGWRNWD